MQFQDKKFHLFNFTFDFTRVFFPGGCALHSADLKSEKSSIWGCCTLCLPQKLKLTFFEVF